MLITVWTETIVERGEVASQQIIDSNGDSRRFNLAAAIVGASHPEVAAKIIIRDAFLSISIPNR
jgi:hypothetical protein